MQDSHDLVSSLNPPRHAEIGILPVETLGRVFGLLSAENVNPPYQWLTVTHVCRYWRTTALEAPELWTRLLTLRRAYIAFFLERSKQMPLDIECFKGSSDVWAEREEAAPTAMDMILPHAHRFRTVILDASFSIPFFAHAFPRGAPLLEVLSADFFRRVETPDSVPTILAQGLPALRHLSLFRFPFMGIADIRCRCLRSLEVTDPVISLSPDSWVSFLIETPLLERLDLSNAISPLQPDVENLNSPIEPETQAILPRLSTFHLVQTQTDSGAIALLRRVVPSTDVEVGFTGAEDTPLVGNLEVLGALEAMLKTTGHITPPVSLNIHIRFKRFHVTLWDTPMVFNSRCASESLGDDAAKPRPILDLKLRADGNIRSRICQMLCNTFELSHLQSLEFADSLDDVADISPFSAQQTIRELRNLFGQMVSLRRLLLMCALSGEYAGLLLGNIHEDIPSTQRTLFPRLEDVTILKDLSLEHRFDHDALRHSIQLRSSSDIAVRTVHLCYSTDDDIQHLRQLKPFVSVVECCVPIISKRYVTGMQIQTL